MRALFSNDHAIRPKGRGLISRHPFSLGKYFLINIIIYVTAALLALCANHLFQQVSAWWVLCLLPLFLNRFRYVAGGAVCLFIIATVQYWQHITIWYAAYFIAAIFIGHLSAVVMHNALHNNLKPHWLNPVVGELCALQQLSSGYPVFKFIHVVHHANPDDPEQDMHPPKGYGFWQFIDVSRALIKQRLTQAYYRVWGDGEASRRSWNVQMVLVMVSRFAKAFFLFEALGPMIFCLFYLPSYLANVFLYAAFNYYTHREQPDGTVEIVNLDHNWYYKLCNRLLWGFFYHKNHHLRPKLHNPMKLQIN